MLGAEAPLCGDDQLRVADLQAANLRAIDEKSDAGRRCAGRVEQVASLVKERSGCAAAALDHQQLVLAHADLEPVFRTSAERVGAEIGLALDLQREIRRADVGIAQLI